MRVNTIPPQIYDESMKVIELLRRKSRNVKFQTNYHFKLTHLNEILETIPHYHQIASYADLSRFFEDLPIYCNKSYNDITLSDFKNCFYKYFWNTPNSYNFYFKIGTVQHDLPEEYKIGNGRLLRYMKLPNAVRKFLKVKNKKTSNKDCYMFVHVKSAGPDKATEIAIQMIKRNIGVYKLVHLTEWYYDVYYRILSPFAFCYEPDKHTITTHRISGEEAHSEDVSIPIERDQELDDMIIGINAIIENGNAINELEGKILHVIDVFSLIDRNTPLHIPFLLCIVCLEGLLLSRDDRDYLGWKLAEKIAFLLGNSDFWIRSYYKVGYEHLMPSHVPIPEELRTSRYKIAEARIGLYYRMRELYGKRSGFAHGKATTDDMITDEDYSQLYSILRLAVIIELMLIKKGFTHVARKARDDKHYLDRYFEELKYS